MIDKKSPAKERVVFIFHCARTVTRQRLENLFDTTIDPAYKGHVVWEID